MEEFHPVNLAISETKTFLNILYFTFFELFFFLSILSFAHPLFIN